MSNKKQIYIHQIQAPSAKNLMPLAAGLLASFLKKDKEILENYNIDINIIRENPQTTSQKCCLADVQAFSCYSWNFQQNVAVAKKIKSLNPNCLIIFGGPSIALSQRFDELKVFFEKYDFVDVVVHGMGEWTLLDILKARLLGKGFEGIDSITYKNKKSKIGFTSNTHSKSNFKKNVNEVPSPFLDGTFDKILAHHKEIISGTLWETNRGCPFSCTFCVQGDSIFNNVEHFNMDRLRNELDWIGRNKIPYIFCTDANFGMFKRDVEIAKIICDVKKKYKYPNYFMVNWGKNLSERVLEVAKVLRGDRKRVKSLDLQPGDLQIFKGRFSMHRVTKIEGNTSRYIALPCYVKDPLKINKPEHSKQVYGKALPIHFKRENIQGDGLTD